MVLFEVQIGLAMKARYYRANDNFAVRAYGVAKQSPTGFAPPDVTTALIAEASWGNIILLNTQPTGKTLSYYILWLVNVNNEKIAVSVWL